MDHVILVRRPSLVITRKITLRTWAFWLTAKFKIEESKNTKKNTCTEPEK